MTRLKDVALLNREALPENGDADRLFRYVDIGSVDNVGGITDAEELRFEAAPSRARRLVQPGDSIVSTVRTYLRAIAHIGGDADDLVVSTGFTTVSPRAGAHSRFLFWALRSSSFIGDVVARSVGVSYPAITATDLGTVPTPLPPLDEQRRIADYLDAETAGIDELIAEQTRFSSLMDEEREAHLGLLLLQGSGEPGGSALPCGTRVPDTWPVVTLRQAGTKLCTGPFGTAFAADEYVPGGEVPMINPTHIRDGHLVPDDHCRVSVAVAERLGRHRLRAGDIVLGRKGDVGRSALVTDAESGWVCGSDSIAIRPASDVLEPGYLAWMLRLSVIRQQLMATSTGATMANVNEGNLLLLRVPRPSHEVQCSLVHAAAEIDARILGLEDECCVQIDLLRERRQALITTAVTRGIDGLPGVV